MVLSPQEPWHVAAITAAIAIVSKYLFRTRTANIFNPAALALVATFHLFHTGQSWWGALPGVPAYGLIVLIATGLFITDRVNKMPMVLAPDLQAVLFFAFFILTDPPTAPAKYSHQVACAALVAVTSFAIFEWIGVADYLLAGVLAGNIWEAWRRARRHARPGRDEPAFGIGRYGA